ncbi:MAG: hypothetical protein U0Z53_09350 [Blastocatellia bacterium]
MADHGKTCDYLTGQAELRKLLAAGVKGGNNTSLREGIGLAGGGIHLVRTQSALILKSARQDWL